ncbi:MAG: hypothetical protein ACI8WT_001608 [Clostridium sp.]|jgi:hypothetical protein
MEQKNFLRQFGVPENIISNVIIVNKNNDYYWSVEVVGDNLIAYCARNKNDIYDGNDNTLTEKIVTGKNLFFKNKEIEYSLVIEEYVNNFENNHKAYVVTSLNDSFCVYEKL